MATGAQRSTLSKAISMAIAMMSDAPASINAGASKRRSVGVRTFCLVFQNFAGLGIDADLVGLAFVFDIE